MEYKQEGISVATAAESQSVRRGSRPSDIKMSGLEVVKHKLRLHRTAALCRLLLGRHSPSSIRCRNPDEFPPSHVLVTGATGFVGAHVVELLLERGIKVTGTARSRSRANEMKARREKYGDLFSIVITGDLTTPNVFDDVVQDVDVVMHLASVSPHPAC